MPWELGGNFTHCLSKVVFLTPKKFTPSFNLALVFAKKRRVEYFF
jgi:hypothetical protein